MEEAVSCMNACHTDVVVRTVRMITDPLIPNITLHSQYTTIWSIICRPSKYSIRNATDILEYEKVSYYLRHQSFTPTPLPTCLSSSSIVHSYG